MIGMPGNMVRLFDYLAGEHGLELELELDGVLWPEYTLCRLYCVGSYLGLSWMGLGGVTAMFGKHAGRVTARLLGRMDSRVFNPPSGNSGITSWPPFRILAKVLK